MPANSMMVADSSLQRFDCGSCILPWGYCVSENCDAPARLEAVAQLRYLGRYREFLLRRFSVKMHSLSLFVC